MKRNKEWNNSKYEKFIKEGRGTGELSEYKPWLTIQDMPSLGRVSRIYSYKTGRVHHFFSDIQMRYFYLLEWEDKVVDIKEHYPILNIREVVDGEDINFEKYKSGDNTDYVFTTTFLISVKDGNKIYEIARDVKASHELERNNIIEKFEIERRYWKKKNIDWAIVTNKEIPKTKAKNIEWIYSALELDKNEEFYANKKNYFCNGLLSKICQENGQKLIKIIQSFDLDNNLKEGTGLLFFRYLVAKKVIALNMDEKINLNLRAESIILSIREQGADTECS